MKQKTIESLGGGGKKRLINIELLRLLAMFMVMIVHADYKVFGDPTPQECINNGILAFFRIIIEQAATVGVNVFVLISGWFGINYHIKGIANILFQCLYFSVIGLFVAFIGSSNVSVGNIFRELYLGSTLWFVPAYLGLYILSPVLNMFVERAYKKQFVSLLLIYFSFQILYGWINDAGCFQYGYSISSFIGLYLLARFVSIHRPKYVTYTKGCYLLLFLICAFIPSALLYITMCTGSTVSYWLNGKCIAYNSPFCIIGAMSLLIFFSKIEISNKQFIRYLSTSCFAMYLFHANTFIFDYYKNIIYYLYKEGGQFVGLFYILSFIIAVSLLSVILDKGRIYLWNRTQNSLISKCHQ